MIIGGQSRRLPEVVQEVTDVSVATTAAALSFRCDMIREPISRPWSAETVTQTFALHEVLDPGPK